MVLFPIFFEMTPISPLDILVKIVTSDSLVRFVTSIRWIFPSVFRAETVADWVHDGARHRFASRRAQFL